MVALNQANTGLCPGCGLSPDNGGDFPDGDYNVPCRSIYEELIAFTLSLGDNEFIHQLVVDAYAAQHSMLNPKNITTTFALVGLYLAFEHGFSGRQVQRCHMILAETRRQWPRFELPGPGQARTVADVTRGLTEDNYKTRIEAWGRSVWEKWSGRQGEIGRLVEEYLGIPDIETKL